METITLRKGLRIETKYEHFAREIRQRIKQNVYTGRLPGLRELAAEYDTNSITMRKALDKLEKEGLIHIRQGSGIFIRGERHYSIGVVGFFEKDFLFTYHHDGYFAQVFSRMLRSIDENAHFFSYQKKSRGIKLEDLFRQNSHVDGLIVFAPCLDEEPELLRLREKQVPFVSVGSTFPNPAVNYVDSDNIGDSCRAVEFLIDRGHRRIAYVNINTWRPAENLRLEGYRRALAAHGLPYEPALTVRADPATPAFAEAVRGIFQRADGPTALFGGNEQAAARALEIAGDKRKDLELVVYDDLMKLVGPLMESYTVVTQPLTEIGDLSMDVLYKLIELRTVQSFQEKLNSTLVRKMRGDS